MFAVEELAIAEPAVRQAVVEFLRPHEIRALFLLGNLKRQHIPQHLYLMRNQADWLALVGYYPSARSLIPFALPDTPNALTALVSHVAQQHPDCQWYLGAEALARPGLEALQAAGYKVVNDPAQVFMELAGLPPPQPLQDQVRLMQPDDHERVIRLLRWLRAGVDDGRVITDAERTELVLNPDRVVLEVDGQVVATAATNGLGIAAYQILGVATDPAHRGRGYAGATVTGLMQIMAGRGGRHTVLFTRHDNSPAIRCYQKLGFTITGDYLLAKLARADASVGQ